MAEHGRVLTEEDSSNGGVSSSCSHSSPCPICLSPITSDAYLDQCFHKFCYNCILQWVNVVASKRLPRPSSVKCPLCKVENFSIVHGYSEGSFLRHYVNKELENSAFFSKAHKYRLQCYYTEAGSLIDTFNVPRFWKLRKYLHPNRGLHNWLQRELQALTQEEDVDVIVHHIVGAIDSFRRNEQKHSLIALEAKKEEFKNLISQAARPFLTGRTDRFFNELELFLASGFTIEAFDKVYIEHLGWKIPELTKEDEEGEPSERAPRVPYMYFLDEDSERSD